MVLGEAEAAHAMPVSRRYQGPSARDLGEAEAPRQCQLMGSVRGDHDDHG
jgi:hypothetical protein